MNVGSECVKSCADPQPPVRPPSVTGRRATPDRSVHSLHVSKETPLMRLGLAADCACADVPKSTGARACVLRASRRISSRRSACCDHERRRVFLTSSTPTRVHASASRRRLRARGPFWLHLTARSVRRCGTSATGDLPTAGSSGCRVCPGWRSGVRSSCFGLPDRSSCFNSRRCGAPR